jgi:hypothetical protein
MTKDPGLSQSSPCTVFEPKKSFSHGTRYMGSEKGVSSPQKHAHIQP